MMVAVHTAKEKVMNGCVLDETSNSLISVSCCLHVLQSTVFISIKMWTDVAEEEADSHP